MGPTRLRPGSANLYLSSWMEPSLVAIRSATSEGHHSRLMLSEHEGVPHRAAVEERVLKPWMAMGGKVGRCPIGMSADHRNRDCLLRIINECVGAGHAWHPECHADSWTERDHSLDQRTDRNVASRSDRLRSIQFRGERDGRQ